MFDKPTTNFKNRRFKCLTIHINNSIINMYYLKKENCYAKKILEKHWNVDINYSMCI